MKRLLIALALMIAAPAWAQSPKVHARLVAEQVSVAPGGKVAVALEEDIREGWHTYWVNAGDVGSPTEIAWQLPAGWKAGPIAWPTPKRLPVAGFMDYGYEGKVWLISDLTAPADAKPGETVSLKAKASWLVCEKICVPEEAELSVPVTIGTPMVNAAAAKDFSEARARLPVASPWKLVYAPGDDLDLYVAAPALVAAHPKEAAFFPLASQTIVNTAPQDLGFARDGVVLRMKAGAKPPAPRPLQGVLVLTSSDGSVQALNVDAPLGAVPPADFPANGDMLSLALAILFAFLGGLILNVMPCVLPILAMKALALAGHGGRARHEAALEGFSYAGGAILSFVAIGLVLVILRAGGESIGWGFQLQQPLAVAGFALLIFAVGLNLSGVFEVGSVSAGGGLAGKSGPLGAFFTGVLAVAVAAPCTAPFMAAALGFALTQGAPAAIAVFFALGVGFALPFLMVGVMPGALSVLPRPGPWMLRLKKILALPMYAWALWLGWVLYAQVGQGGVMVLAAAAAALGVAAFLWQASRGRDGMLRIGGLVAALLLLAGGAAALTRMPGEAPPAGLTAVNAYTAAKLDALRAQNKPVFIDATAAWCITCLVNEQAVLSRPEIKAAFAAKGVTYLVADWTNRNAEITELLEDNARDGVPLYLYYAPGAAKPVILPQILTPGAVLDTLGS